MIHYIRTPSLRKISKESFSKNAIALMNFIMKDEIISEKELYTVINEIGLATTDKLYEAIDELTEQKIIMAIEINELFLEKIIKLQALL